MDERYDFPEPVPTDVTCRHCFDKLTAVAEVHTSLSFAGLREFVWVHTATGEPTCTKTYQAQPYDAFDATRQFKQAQRAQWAAKDGYAATDGGGAS